MAALKELIREVLNEEGLTDRTITQRQGEKRYGKWFADAVKAGAIKPVRTGVRTRYYSIPEIKAYERKGRELARIQMETIKHNSI